MVTEKIQVVFCTDGIFPHAIGGMQRHSRLLIEELAKIEGMEIIAIHPHHDKKIFDPFLDIKEIAIKKAKPHYSYMWNEYRYSKQVFEALKEFPDAIIYSQGLSVWSGINEIGHRIILNPHGLEYLQAIGLKQKVKAKRFTVLFNYLFKHSAKVVSLGGRLTGLLNDNIENAENKIVILPNAVNMPVKKTERVFQHDPLNILFVGRFAANKGIHILIECIKSLNKEGYEQYFKFNLVGKGPFFEEYISSFQASNLNYLGFADDDKLIQLYQENDLFVLPTLYEGMPTVILEAMSYGMPIIVTDTGATTELVDHTNGFIIEKNNPSALKNAIKRFYQFELEKRKALSERSVIRVEESFTWNVVAQKHFELFKDFSSKFAVHA